MTRTTRALRRTPLGSALAIWMLGCPAGAQCWKYTGEVSVSYGSSPYSISLSGDTMASGSPQASSTGEVRVFESDGQGLWSEVKRLLSTATESEEFGWSAAIDGDTLAVGARLADSGYDVRKPEGAAYDSSTGTLFTAERKGSLVRVDTLTGQGYLEVPHPFDDLQGLAYDPGTGTLYGSDTSIDSLVTIDIATGVGTVVGPIGFLNVRGLAFDPNKRVLYGTDTDTAQLLTIDPATGAGTAIGAMGVLHVAGLAYDPSTDTLYGGKSNFIYTVDTATGAATLLGPSGSRGLAFDADTDTLYGIKETSAATDSLFVLDPDGGSATLIGKLDTLAADGGEVIIHERDLGGPDAWGERIRFAPPGNENAPGQHFGHDTSLSGDTLLVGAPRAWAAYGSTTTPGRAFLFERDLGGPDGWGMDGILDPPGSVGDIGFGYSVSIDGDTAVVGGLTEEAAWVYERDLGGPGSWGLAAQLVASDGLPGDGFGNRVAIHGDVIAVGAPASDTLAFLSGAAYVFERNAGGPGAWGEVAKLVDPDAVAKDQFGLVVAVRGDVIGVSTGSSFGNDGEVHLFERDAGGPGAWGSIGELSAPNPGGSFGSGFAISGQTLVAQDLGTGLFFEESDITSYCTAGISASGCQATLSATGTPSASSPSGFFVHASTVEGNKPGLFFFGTSGKAASPWGNGTSWRCTPLPVSRAGLLPVNGTTGACDGTYSYDLNARWQAKPSQNPGGGTLTQVQLWYRDPLNTSNQGTSFSDALEFCVRP